MVRGRQAAPVRIDLDRHCSQVQSDLEHELDVEPKISVQPGHCLHHLVGEQLDELEVPGGHQKQLPNAAWTKQGYYQDIRVLSPKPRHQDSSGSNPRAHHLPSDRPRCLQGH